VSLFDVRIHAIRRRRNRHRPFEVRWHAAGRGRLTGRSSPGGWPTVTVPSWSARPAGAWSSTRSPASPSCGRRRSQVPPRGTVTRSATRPATAAALSWLERASLPVTRLQDPRVTRQALDALAVRLDGRRAAANTIARKRAVFHNALGYAVELGLLEASPLGQHRRRTPGAASTADPRVIASPGQVDAILTQVTRIRPELTASSAACTTRRCAPRKPSRCTVTASPFRPAGGAS
jgi:hypothetical protein